MRDRTALLRLGVTPDELRCAPKCTAAILQDNQCDLPAPLRIEHETKLASLSQILADFTDDLARIRAVMNDSEGIDEVVALDWHEPAQLLSVTMMEAGGQPEDLEALPAKLQARLGQFDDGQVGSRTGEIDRIGADPAADLQNLLTSPTVELSESWDMRLDEILPGLDLVEIIP